MSAPKIHSFDELKSLVRTKRAEYTKSAMDGEEQHSMGAGASGDSAGDVSDASDKGTKSIPSDPSVSNENSTLPGSTSDNNPDGDGNANGNIGNGSTKGHPTDATDDGNRSNPDDPSESNDNSNLPSNGEQQETSSRSATSVSKSAMQLIASIKKNANTAAKGYDPTKVTTPATKGNAIGPVPKDGKNSDSSKTAGADLTQVDGFHAKLASSKDNLAALGDAVLKFEGGLDFAKQMLRKSAGADMANEIIHRAAVGKQVLDQHTSDQAAYEHFMKNASAEEKAHFQTSVQVDELMKTASQDDIASMNKLAAIHNENVKSLTDGEKRAYDQGAGDAALMQDMAAEGGDPAMAEGGMPPEMGAEMGGEAPEPSIEEILMILQQLVESGQIDPATAEELMTLLAEGEAGGDPAAMGAEEAPMDPAEAEAMAAAGPPPGMEAQASVQHRIKAAAASLKKS